MGGEEAAINSPGDPNQDQDPKTNWKKEPKATPDEYKLAAERYNEIYKAVWQNFSYMALLSGAILTFGKDTAGPTAAALTACIPLLVWYWATFEPLNRYGTLVEHHLTVLERELGYRLYTKLYRNRFRGKTKRDRDKDALGAPNRVPYYLSVLGIISAFVVGYRGWFEQPVTPVPQLVASGVLIVIVVFFGSLFKILVHDHTHVSVRRTIRLLFGFLVHAVFALLLGMSVAKSIAKAIDRPSTTTSPSTTTTSTTTTPTTTTPTTTTPTTITTTLPPNTAKPVAPHQSPKRPSPQKVAPRINQP
jgi:hypothetical protein